MGCFNFTFLLVVVPAVYMSAFFIFLYEKQHQYMIPFLGIITDQIGINEQKVSIFCICSSIFLWWISFVLSTFMTALYRTKMYDNNHPRLMKEKQAGLPHRLYSAHQNEGEQFPFISVAIILGIIFEVDISVINLCAVGYVFHRIIFHIMYPLNIDILRSLSYGVSFVCIYLYIYLFNVFVIRINIHVFVGKYRNVIWLYYIWCTNSEFIFNKNDTRFV